MGKNPKICTELYFISRAANALGCWPRNNHLADLACSCLDGQAHREDPHPEAYRQPESALHVNHRLPALSGVTIYCGMHDSDCSTIFSIRVLWATYLLAVHHSHSTPGRHSRNPDHTQRCPAAPLEHSHPHGRLELHWEMRLWMPL